MCCRAGLAPVSQAVQEDFQKRDQHGVVDDLHGQADADKGVLESLGNVFQSYRLTSIDWRMNYSAYLVPTIDSIWSFVDWESSGKVAPDLQERNHADVIAFQYSLNTKTRSIAANETYIRSDNSSIEIKFEKRPQGSRQKSIKHK